MGTRTERQREAQARLDRAGKGQPERPPGSHGQADHDAPDRSPTGPALPRAVEDDQREAGRQDHEPRPSAWQWSRGADILALLLLFALLGIAGAASAAGVTALAWLSIAAAAFLVVALVIHAATAGRRFGGP